MSKVTRKLVLNRDTVKNLTLKSGLRAGESDTTTAARTRDVSSCATIPQGPALPQESGKLPNLVPNSGKLH